MHVIKSNENNVHKKLLAWNYTSIKFKNCKNIKIKKCMLLKVMRIMSTRSWQHIIKTKSNLNVKKFKSHKNITRTNKNHNIKKKKILRNNNSDFHKNIAAWNHISIQFECPLETMNAE